MALFTWSDRFSVGIKEMDQQHKKMVDLINYLHNSKLNKKQEEAIGKILNDLVEYTKTHFAKEEALMSNNMYPNFYDHKGKHIGLILKVEILRKKYELGDKDICTEIAILLNDWLAEHIIIEDKKYGLYLNGIGTT